MLNFTHLSFGPLQVTMLFMSEVDYIVQKIAAAEANIDIIGILQAPPLNSPHPYLLLWDPLALKDVDLFCFVHPNEQLSATGRWTSGTNKSYQPRRLFNYGRNVALVSALYTCKKCTKPFRAHDPVLLRQLPESFCCQFILFHRSGVTKSLYSLVQGCLENGVTFKGVQEILEKGYQDSKAELQRAAGVTSLSNLNQSLYFKAPSRQYINDLCLFHYRVFQDFYKAQLASYQPVEVSFDHTFDVRFVL